MAQTERFDVTITLSIKGDKGFFAQTEQKYCDMSYDTMQTAQGNILKSLVNVLVAMGDERVGDKDVLTLARSLVK